MENTCQRLKQYRTANGFFYNEDKDYLKDYLSYYIEKEAVYEKQVLDKRWVLFEDEQTRLRRLFLNYILENFNLQDLFLIFFFNQFQYGLYESIIRDARKAAIENISFLSTRTPAEIRKLKRKVWDLNPILFGQIMEFIHHSDLFFDDENEECIYPNGIFPDDLPQEN
jgi:hypothetical protein